MTDEHQPDTYGELHREPRHVTRRGGGNALGRRSVAAAVSASQNCCCASDRTCLLHYDTLSDVDRAALTGRRSTARLKPAPDADRRRWNDLPTPGTHAPREAP